MLPSSDDLVSAVGSHSGLKTRELAAKLDVPDEEFDDFVELALRLQREGLMVRAPQAGWQLPERTPFRVGTLQIDRRGRGFVRVAPGSIKEEGLFVRPEDVQTAFHGDLVLVRVGSRAGRRSEKEGRLREARVVDIIQRGRRLIRGKYWAGKRGGFVEPSGLTGAPQIFVSLEESADAADGEKVLVRLLDGASRGAQPRGKVVARSRHEGTFQSDLGVIRELFDLPAEHPEPARAEAAGMEGPVSGAAWPGRVDLRQELVFTIDPVDAKDFDDAISLKRLEGRDLCLDVHIADVSHYVRPGSALDLEAARRGTSVYLPGCVLPMLPERLANDLCSLKPGEDRLTKTVRMTWTPSGDLKRAEVFRSVIRSRRRFTYEEVLAILVQVETGKATASLPPDHAEFEGILAAMAHLRDKLHRQRHKRGALYLDIPKLRLTVDASGTVTGLGQDARDPSHSLIEEFMLAANEAVASYHQAQHLPLVARVHPAPDPEKLADFQKFLEALGFRLEVRDGSRDLQRVVEKVADDPLSAVAQLALLRTMGHAEYVLGAGLHFALATGSYCHFTSPIRRYPDLLVHQILDHHFDSRKRDQLREWERRLPRAAEKASADERQAEEAEREMVRLRLIRYLQPLVGQEMSGWIISVHPFGFFVRVDVTLVEGLVHVATLGDDYYQFDRDRLLLAGQRRRRCFKVGDRVRVELAELDADLREISFRFIKRLGAHP